MTGSSTDSLPFAKGHGTGNDFVLLPDPDAALDLTPALVAAICDRRTGVGADGVLRVVPSALAPEAYDQATEATWFMDYRNADGSLAEMCGNGVRVFARFLADRGLETGPRFRVATRAGVRAVELHGDGMVTVDMGPAKLTGEAGVRVRVGDAPEREAVAVDVGNPHAVVFVDDLAAVGALSAPPVVLPASAFPHGVNVELVAEVGPHHVAMRVHERGVGETQSCGTGACAVFAAALARAGGPEAGGSDPGGETVDWTVDVPGGRLRLRRRADGGIDLTGPAEVVASGELDPRWLAARLG